MEVILFSRTRYSLAIHKSVSGLGFHTLHDFNLAMLGKQGWHILTQPTSLVARVFKASCYPEGDFLSVGLGSNLSFIWKSVWESKKLLKEGFRRRIGNGATTRILHNPWFLVDERPRITHTHSLMEK